MQIDSFLRDEQFNRMVLRARAYIFKIKKKKRRAEVGSKKKKMANGNI